MGANKGDLRRFLAENLKQQRKILGISQEKLAEMAGLSWQMINSIECQRTWVSDNTLETLAGVLNMDSFVLLMPPETRRALSVDAVATLRRLAELKKAYDNGFNELMSPEG